MEDTVVDTVDTVDTVVNTVVDTVVVTVVDKVVDTVFDKVVDTVVDTVDQCHLSSHFPNANLQRWFGNEMRESEQQMAML